MCRPCRAILPDLVIVSFVCTCVGHLLLVILDETDLEFSYAFFHAVHKTGMSTERKAKRCRYEGELASPVDELRQRALFFFSPSLFNASHSW